jgi:hypothetical protein
LDWSDAAVRRGDGRRVFQEIAEAVSAAEPAADPFGGFVIDRGFVTADERPALLAYLRKL